MSSANFGFSYCSPKTSHPGGCELGARPIDLHLKALRDMGATVAENNGFIDAEANRLIGARIHLDLPSVGATENIMLAAVLAKGETIIINAAREPEICDLQGFLNAMGARVKGAGTNTVVIKGVEKLHDAEYSVMPDRITAGTFLAASAITNGQIQLNGVVLEHIYPFTTKLAETGCLIREGKNKIYLNAPKRLLAVDKILTQYHPGFPTDMQAQFMALLSIAEGTSVITENIFESRNKHVGELTRMGADIILSLDGKTSVIKGVQKLSGTVVNARDLRGGAALILAGLAAEGETAVLNSEHIERGYESIEKSLASLGADIVFKDYREN